MRIHARNHGSSHASSRRHHHRRRTNGRSRHASTNDARGHHDRVRDRRVHDRRVHRDRRVHHDRLGHRRRVHHDRRRRRATTAASATAAATAARGHWIALVTVGERILGEFTCPASVADDAVNGRIVRLDIDRSVGTHPCVGIVDAQHVGRAKANTEELQTIQKLSSR